MSDLTNIKSGIKTILEAIVETGGSTRKIVIVYNYPESSPSGYPFCWIDYKGDVSSVLNNVEDLVEYEFEVNLVQEKIEDLKGRANAESTAMERSFDINEAFRADNDLGVANVIRVRPIETIKSYVDNATRIMLKIKLLVLTKETITL